MRGTLDTRGAALVHHGTSVGRRALLVGGGAVALLLAGTDAVGARPLLVDEQVTPSGGRQEVRIRVQTGCEDLPTDRVEVTIPPDVLGVIPEAVPGWTATTTVEPTEAYDLFGTTLEERVAAITWSGGPLPANQYQEFGFLAALPDEGRVALPVIQGCGDREASFTQIPPDGEEPSDPGTAALLLSIVPPPPSVDAVALQAQVERLQQRTRDLADRLDQVPVEGLRSRLRDLEAAVAALRDAVGVPGPSPAPGG